MNFKEQIDQVKIAFLAKSITYEEAKKQALPLIEAFNDRSKEIAKKYGKRPVKLSFVGLFR